MFKKFLMAIAIPFGSVAAFVTLTVWVEILLTQESVEAVMTFGDPTKVALFIASVITPYLVFTVGYFFGEEAQARAENIAQYREMYGEGESE
ncbi:hypothetical protein JXR01_01570 [Candidatus Kaiserbacteria bacterium]|nr:MAG: hypothetical protein JXR01_01570 [Candidatus Kaiserbacteria bacterium]